MSEYRVLFNPHFSHMPRYKFTKECKSEKEAEQILSAIGDYTLYLHEAELMPDHSNYGVVQMLIDGEWIDIDDL